MVDGASIRTGEVRDLNARYLVGVDGANSFVRRALGVEREDLQFDERWLVCDMEIIEPVALRINIGQICDPARPRMLMPLGHKHRRFEWMVLPGESTAEMERPETSWRLLEEFGVTPTKPSDRPQCRLPVSSKDRRTMAGTSNLSCRRCGSHDAALRGPGHAVFIEGREQSGWKLDLCHAQRMRPSSLLDSYEDERRAHVRAWTEISLAEGRISCELDPSRAAERDARLLAGEKLPAPHPPRIEDGIVPAVGSPYANPLAGTLGLQARVRANGGEGLFDDVFGPSRFAVLTMGGDQRRVCLQRA